MKRVFLLPYLFIITCSGCASIMCKDEKSIGISSEPSGVKFEIVAPGGQVITQGFTPSRVTLKRGRGYFQAGDYTARFYGFEDNPTSVRVRQGFETGWYFGGNLVFGGLIGILFVDPITGAMWDIKDVHVNVDRYDIAYLKPPNMLHEPEEIIEGRRLKGYQGKINPKTGEMEIYPVYEDEK